MNKYKLAFFTVLAGLVLLGLFFLLRTLDFAVLDAKGTISQAERDLIALATALMLIVVIPVFLLTAFIAWRYREGNKKARYSPDWDHNRAIEFTWWAFPSIIILVLAVVTWNSTHELDPSQPIRPNEETVTIQVVALQWKWLFIYPEEGVASVNFLEIPKNTPVAFEVTSDAPMNSFWIPNLGGQIYAMAGMKTKIHLLAHELGDYSGVSANISGEGFSGMRFTARVSESGDYKTWIQQLKATSEPLDFDKYNNLAEPSRDSAAVFFGATEQGLYGKIIGKYLAPAPQLAGVSTEQYQQNYQQTHGAH